MKYSFRWSKRVQSCGTRPKKYIETETPQEMLGEKYVKKYVFNDQMRFLKKCYESREASESVEDTVVVDNDKTEMSETQHGKQDDGGKVTKDIDIRAGKRQTENVRSQMKWN